MGTGKWMWVPQPNYGCLLIFWSLDLDEAQYLNSHYLPSMCLGFQAVSPILDCEQWAVSEGGASTTAAEQCNSSVGGPGHCWKQVVHLSSCAYPEVGIT